MTMALEDRAEGSLRPVLAGAIVGFDNLARTVALTALVFGGALASGAPLAILVFLITNFFATLSLVTIRAAPAPLFSSVQNAPVAILLPAIAAIATNGETLAVFLVLGLTTVMAGLAMIAVALFDLGRFIRLLPYPVTAGFLASVGLLLVRSALEQVGASDLISFGKNTLALSQDALIPILAIAFALCLGLAVSILRNSGLILMLVLGLSATYLTLNGLGISETTSREMGLLAAPLPPATLPSITEIGALLGGINADMLRATLPLAAAAALISIFGVMLNVSGAEIMLNRDIDNRKVLYRTGLVNLLTGGVGSAVSYPSASNTDTAFRLSSHGRKPVLTYCVLMGLVLPFSGKIYALIPNFISAGLILYIGASILKTWLFDQFHRLHRAEWVLICSIVIATLTFGMIAAMGLGVLAASIIFAVMYARLPVIHKVSDLRSLRSTVDRGPAQSAFLGEHGGEVAVVSLQGFLFFGTVSRLNAHLKGLLEAPGTVHTVIFDFKRVSRIDTSTIEVLRRLEQLASARGCRLILADMNKETREEIERSGLSLGPGRVLQTVQNTDEAMEAAEEELLEGLQDSHKIETALTAVQRIIDNSELATRLLKLMQREAVTKGTKLIRQGEHSGDIFIVDKGRLAVLLSLQDGRIIRLRTMAAGALVGEIASYAGLPRTADVVAQTDAVVYRADADQIARFMRNDPEIAAALHLLVASTLAEKLDRTNKLLGQNS